MALAWLTVLVAASLRFTMDTASVGRLDSRVVVGASALLAGLLLAAVYWPARRSESGARRLRPLELIALASASAVLQAGLPMLVFANRSSDAPPGSVVAFWTTVFFGGLMAMGGSLAMRAPWLRVASALLLIVGGAGVLANWERPSSFSLLVRYTEPQMMMALAAAISAFLLLWLSARVKQNGWSTTVVPVAVGSILGGVVLLASARDSLDSLPSPIVLLAAGASAVLYLMILSLGPGRGALLSGTAIAGVPAAITLLTVLESMIGMLGPRPLLLAPITAASVVGGFAIALVLREYPPATRQVPTRLPLVIAVAGVAAALAGMLAPALGVAVKGSRGRLVGVRSHACRLGRSVVTNRSALTLRRACDKRRVRCRVVPPAANAAPYVGFVDSARGTTRLRHGVRISGVQPACHRMADARYGPGVHRIGHRLIRLPRLNRQYR